MSDMELAEEIEQVILAGNKVGIPLASIIKMGFTSQQWNEIIAALRRAELAQTEIKGHMRVVEELQARVAALEEERDELKHHIAVTGALKDRA